MSKNKRVESVQEYLARGGSIKKLPAAEQARQEDVTRKTTAGPAVFLSLEEADLFFGEPSKSQKTKKVKSSLKIDLDALPPALRAKFISKLKEGVDAEGYEEEIQDLEEDDSNDGDD